MTQSTTVNTSVQVGDVVADKYCVERVIGEGGMGLVVAATHQALGQRVALKFLLPAAAGREQYVKRFMREARTAVKVQSDHVARVFDVGTHCDLPYIVMEYLEGEDLAHVMQRGAPLDVKTAVGYVLEACDALAEAHAIGLVHRDIKPANLFLAKRPRGRPIIKVLDFGISKAPLNDKESAITNAASVLGTPSYMSPEQLTEATSVDARSDIWALGVVLYELCARKRPFTGANMNEMIARILEGRYAPLKAAPGGLQEIIDRCLRTQRAERFQTVAELATALLPFASSSYASLVHRTTTSSDAVAAVAHLDPHALPTLAAPTKNERRGVPTSLTFPTFDRGDDEPVVVPLRRPSKWLWMLVLAAAAGATAVAFHMRRAKHGRPKTSSAEVTPPSFAVNVPPPPSVLPSAAATASTHTMTPYSRAPTPIATASPSASASACDVPPPAPSASACRPVSYFDAKGTKRFRMQCD